MRESVRTQYVHSMYTQSRNICLQLHAFNFVCVWACMKCLSGCAVISVSECKYEMANDPRNSRDRHLLPCLTRIRCALTGKANE